MKKNTVIIFLLSLLFITSATAQSKVKEKKILGTWKLVINLDEEFDKARDELDDEDSYLEKAVINSVDGLVSGLLDEIDVFMEFQKGGSVDIFINAFGNEEKEQGKWLINNEGKLIITENDSSSFENDGYWLFVDELLVNYDEKNSKSMVYLVKVN